MTMRVLLTHTPHVRANYYGDVALARLRELVEVRLHESDAPLDTAGLIAQARDCDVIIADRQTDGEAALFEALPGLVAFLRCAMDIRSIDVPAASRAGVLVTRATAGFVDAVAELAIGFMIDLSRGVSRATASYRAGDMPAIEMGVQLSTATVGIIGFGAIGRQVGTLAGALGMTVLASDPVLIAQPGIEQVEMAELLGRSDFVICLAPVLPETENLMDARAFAAMRRGSFFINLARGELVDEASLIAALDRGHLRGAAVDVGRAPNQMPSPALAGRADVIATPHIGGLTPEATQHQAFDTVEQVAALLQGRLPPGAVNAEHADRLKRLLRETA
ncbi:NAD(P)-dependent oxidoreductase [Bosea sp. BK604]|uniref:NAD(P)-dependent oxidoreductase n=1 Tax=Bosea sp. BK604 TaxID=2512180 RepID=UPI0010F0B357|nr:NAD(P)-dependent oxidoreductase [Bosea sp. BK604]TCR62981.1 D-3-phosphoglycerate dehydrogenase [Bosea sp. BK604]